MDITRRPLASPLPQGATPRPRAGSHHRWIAAALAGLGLVSAVLTLAPVGEPPAAVADVSGEAVFAARVLAGEFAVLDSTLSRDAPAAPALTPPQ